MATILRQLTCWMMRLILGGMLTVAGAATVQPDVLDVAELGQHALTPYAYIRVLEDPTASLTLADVSKPDAAQRFGPVPDLDHPMGFGTTRSVVWLALPLKNSASTPSDVMLEVPYSRLGYLDFFVRSANGAVKANQTGNLLPFAQRPYPHHFFVQPITVPAHEALTVYLRVQTPNTMNVPVQLWTRDAFDAYERTDYVVQAWYFGMVTAMVIFNLLLFVSLRDTNYLLYVGFVASLALTMAAFNGLAFEFLWSDTPALTPIATYVGPSLSMVGLLLFTRRMLGTPVLVPRLDRAMQACIVLLVVLPLGLTFALPQTVKLGYALVVVSSLLILLSGLIGSLRGQRSAMLFVLAFAGLCLALIASQVRALGFGLNMDPTTDGIQVGSAIEMLLLAFALADRFHVLRREKAQAQAQALHAQSQLVQTLQTSERELEAHVAQRTLELSDTVTRLHKTQDELVQAEKLASLGALVAGVAHELNTPIGNALTTSTALEHRMKDLADMSARGELRRSTLEELVRDGQEMAALITRSCVRAGDLITSFKQVAVDQTSEQRKTFDLRTLVEETIAVVRAGLMLAPWRIEVDVPEDLQCDSYPGPLGQVLINLVQNAALHAFAGRATGCLKISAQLTGNAISMQVEDDGVGMSPHTLAHIFEPFFTTRLGQGGSGLGLPVSRNIVTAMLGGSLTVHSTANVGTSFILVFPQVAPQTGAHS